MERTFLHLRLALRSLRRQPRFSAVVILMLALGIGVNTAVLNAIYTLIVRPLPYLSTQDLVALGMHPATLDVEAYDFSLADIDDFTAACTVCAGVAAFDAQTVVLAANPDLSRAIANLFLRRGQALLGVGAGLGLLGGGAAVDLLGKVIYDAAAGRSAAFVSALVIFATVVAIGIAIPALRATHVEPAITLRQE